MKIIQFANITALNTIDIIFGTVLSRRAILLSASSKILYSLLLLE